MQAPIASQSARWLLLCGLTRLAEDPSDLRETLNSAIRLIVEELGLERGAITLISPRTGKIRIEASHGLSARQRKRGEYLPGEGVTGAVIASGSPMLIDDASREPLFLNRTGCRDFPAERVAFLCVPLLLFGQAVGALSVDCPRLERPLLEDLLEFLRVAAALIAHAAYEPEPAADQGLRFGFIGGSEQMLKICGQIAIVAPSQAAVLLQGESGTGKELAARAIHNQSERKNGPFIALNCAALPESLIESELFGHEKGAFTGAAQARKGRFELAGGGTLFLDEVGELPLLAQAKLLRALQERSFERLGGARPISLDARLVAATNRDLGAMTEEGLFRRDLFYRLNVFPIQLPPLRERREDILPLAAHFLKSHLPDRKKAGLKFSPAAIRMLEAHSWPGNVRELQNAMERAALLMGRDSRVLPEHLAGAFASPGHGPEEEAAPPESDGLKTKLEDLEKAEIIEALSQSNGRVCKAAQALGVSRRILDLRLKKHGLCFADFRKAQAKD